MSTSSPFLVSPRPTMSHLFFSLSFRDGSLCPRIVVQVRALRHEDLLELLWRCLPSHVQGHQQTGDVAERQPRYLNAALSVVDPPKVVLGEDLAPRRCYMMGTCITYATFLAVTVHRSCNQYTNAPLRYADRFDVEMPSWRRSVYPRTSSILPYPSILRVEELSCIPIYNIHHINVRRHSMDRQLHTLQILLTFY